MDFEEARALRKAQVQVDEYMQQTLKLSREARRYVSTQLALDYEQQALASVRAPEVKAARVGRPRGSQRAPAGEEKSLPQRIREYCEAHPSADGIFKVGDIMAALGIHGQNAHTQVATAILRSSPQSDRGPPKHPRFEWLRESKFRLYQGGG
jgi:hypothetical protein